MMRLGYWVWRNVYVCLCECKIHRCRQVIMCMCACMPLWVCVCSPVCVFVCTLCSVKVNTSQVFTEFNDWTFGMTGICVLWDLLLLTRRSQGHKDNICLPSWQQVFGQSGVYFCCHCRAGIMMCRLRPTKGPRYIPKVSVLLCPFDSHLLSLNFSSALSSMDPLCVAVYLCLFEHLLYIPFGLSFLVSHLIQPHFKL